MALTEGEAIACLRVLVCMARIDGEVSPEEKAVLEDVLKGVRLPEGSSIDTLLEEDINLSYQLKQLESPMAKEQAFLAAFNLANADRVRDEAEDKLLQRLRRELDIPKEKISLWARIIGEAKDTFLPSTIVQIEDPEKRTQEINEDTLKYSILCGAMGSFPIPVVGLAADLAIIGLQVKMIRDVGQYWGHAVDNAAAKSLIYGAAGSVVTRVAVRNLVRAVPFWGSAVGAVGAFAATWALGRVADQYFENGGVMNSQTLKDAFQDARKGGEEAYEEHKAKVEEKQQKTETRVRTLSEALEAGQISQEEYEKKIERLA